MPYIYGGISGVFALVWHLLAANKPEEDTPRTCKHISGNDMAYMYSYSWGSRGV